MARIANGLDYHTLPRRKLQLLCKKHGIPANKTNLYMIEALSSLDKEKIDEPSHEGTKLESAHKEGDNKIRESQRCNTGDGAQLPVQSTESGGTVGQFLAESIGSIPYGLQVGIGEGKQCDGPGNSDSFPDAVGTSGVCVSLEDLGTKLGADTIEHLQHLEFKDADVSIPEDATADCVLPLRDDNHTLPSNPPQSLQFKDTFASQVKGETNVSISFEGLETQDNEGRMHGDSSNSTLEVLEIQVNGNNIFQLDDDIAAIQDPKIEDKSQVIKEEVIEIEDAFISQQVKSKTNVSIFFDGLESQGNEERILQLHGNNSNIMVCTPLEVLEVQVNGNIVSQLDGEKNFAANQNPKIEDASQVVREEDLSLSAAPCQDLELGDPDAITSPAKRNWNVPTSLGDPQSPHNTQGLASDSYLSPAKTNSSHVLHEDLEFKGAPITAERMKNTSITQRVMSNEDYFGLPRSQYSQISAEISLKMAPPLEELRQNSSFHIGQGLSIQHSQFPSITSSGHCQQGNSYRHDEKQVANCKLNLKDVPEDVSVSALSHNSDAVAEPINQLSTLCIADCNNLEDSITSRHTNGRQDSYEDMVNVPAFSQEKRIDTDMETSNVSEISVCSAEIHFGIIDPAPLDGLFLDNVSSNASEEMDTDTCPMVHETKCIIPSKAWSRQETSHGSKSVKGVSDLQKVCVYRSSHLKDAWHQIKLNAKHKQHYKRTPFVRATWLSRSLMKGRDKRALLLKQRRANSTLNNTSCSYMETSDYFPDASPLNSCAYEKVRAIPETVRRYSCSSMENLNVDAMPYSPSYEQQAKQLIIFGRKRFIERAMREAARRKQERLGVAPNLSASPMKIASAAQNADLECSEQNKKTRINLYGAKTSEIQKRHQEQFKTPLKGKSFQKARKMASQLASGQREQVLRARRGILASENKGGDCHMRGGTIQNS